MTQQPISTDQIEARYYSPQLFSHGQVVEDIDDINQAIKIILTTQQGSVPHHPRFGARMVDFIDRPINSVTAEIKAEAIRAVEDEEEGEGRRIRVSEVEVIPAPDGALSTLFADRRASMFIRLRWQLIDEDFQSEVLASL